MSYYDGKEKNDLRCPAVLWSDKQNLSSSEKKQARDNLGIGEGGGTKFYVTKVTKKEQRTFSSTSDISFTNGKRNYEMLFEENVCRIKMTLNGIMTNIDILPMDMDEESYEVVDEPVHDMQQTRYRTITFKETIADMVDYISESDFGQTPFTLERTTNFTLYYRHSEKVMIEDCEALQGFLYSSGDGKMSFKGLDEYADKVWVEGNFAKKEDIPVQQKSTKVLIGKNTYEEPINSDFISDLYNKDGEIVGEINVTSDDGDIYYISIRGDFNAESWSVNGSDYYKTIVDVDGEFVLSTGEIESLWLENVKFGKKLDAFNTNEEKFNQYAAFEFVEELVEEVKLQDSGYVVFDKDTKSFTTKRLAVGARAFGIIPNGKYLSCEGMNVVFNEYDGLSVNFENLSENGIVWRMNIDDGLFTNEQVSDTHFNLPRSSDLFGEVITGKEVFIIAKDTRNVERLWSLKTFQFDEDLNKFYVEIEYKGII